jgi:hypothetical protein
MVRRRRLVSQLANLKVEEDETDALFGRALAAIRTPREAVTASPEHLPQVVKLAQAPEETPPLAPAVVETAGESPLLTVVDSPGPTVTDGDEEEQPVEASLEDEIESATDAEAAPDESPPANGDEDDLLAMFRETKAASAVPAALEEAYEQITAADLLAQARDLRDLLRRAA